MVITALGSLIAHALKEAGADDVTVDYAFQVKIHFQFRGQRIKIELTKAGEKVIVTMLRHVWQGEWTPLLAQDFQLRTMKPEELKLLAEGWMQILEEKFSRV